MTAEVERLLDDSPITGQSFAARAADLTRPQRAIYLRILTHFIERSSPPPLDALPANAVARLIEADLIQTGNDRVSVAYPFAAQPTRHQVILHDGRRYYAMCAIDALGIPYLLHARGDLHAREPDAHRIVRVTVDPDGDPTWTPEQAVAVAAFGDGCCLAQSACPHINLFSSPDAAQHHLDTHALRGNILSIPDATTAGKWLFGELLNQLADGTIP